MNTFINGEYYGISNLRDRLDKNTIAERTGLNNKNISIHKNKVLFPKEMHFKQKDIQEIKGAKDSLHDNFISLLENKTLSANSFKELASISSFIDYYAAEIFIANEDWIKNNVAYWRYIGPLEPTNRFADGKYRWVMFDIDSIGGSRNSKKNSRHPTLQIINSKYSENKYYQQSLPLISFLKNTELKLEFITRFSDLLNSWFVPERMIQVIRDAELTIENEMPRHIERWQAPKSMKHWRESVDNLVEFFEQRPKYQWEHLQSFFKLKNTYEIKVDLAIKNSEKIKLNTLTIGDDQSLEYTVNDTPLFFPWTGKYFQSLPLTLEAIPEKGFEFSHWEATATLPKKLKNKDKIVLYPDKDLWIKAIFVPN